MISKEKGQVQIKMYDHNRNSFIATLKNILLAPDQYDRLFYIIDLMDLGHDCLFHKGFCTVQFGNEKEGVVIISHIAQRKHAFLVKTKEKTKSKKIAHIKKVSLELLYHRFGKRSTRSLMAGDTANVWQDIELRIDLDPFCTSCHISSINKKYMSKNPLAPFKWVLIDIITETSPKSFTIKLTFLNIF